ncbi:bifunctional metallophosphatase/5'-nucleotidase [Nesterenkonia aerolata]|uniref:5'-nucleotidase C-terminal domain-containing protein n=1 Tax=Nesterenkonia aerolata TaxID=3074079 RepID=A0ABU2DSM3_9MICC|nr:5'-nucleotidase C-terminal domain-containing protein [Nesterenkonia sp. LY-0111]MDR8019503.1 5'-nucleotidase C-terminal domain-containing protein [Nesterenkonia sp. LY-0111]
MRHRAALLPLLSVVTASALLATACADDTQDNDTRDTGEESAEETTEDNGTAESSASGEVTVLSFNDFHGAMDSAEAFACTLEQVRQEHPENLLISAGDDVGASQFESAVQDDQPTLDLYNALGVDAAALGNHEFDQGYADITDRLEPEADFDYLAANLFEADSQDRAATPYEIYEVDGLEVAVVGGVTAETPELVVPDGVEDIEFRDPIDSAAEVIEEELGEADLVVLSVHQGSAEDLEIGEVPQDDWSSRVHEELGELVDVVLEGHTHNAYAYAHDDLTVLQTGSNGANLGAVTLSVEDGEVQASEPELHATEETDPQDCSGEEAFDEASEVVAEAEEHAAEVGGEQLTTQSGDLTTGWAAGEAEYSDGVWSTSSSGHGDDRSLQSTIGSLVADFHQDSEAWPEDVEIDVGLINAGGLRDDISTEDGEVTLRDAVDVVPFNNRLVALEMTGEQLREVLEQQWGEDGYQQFGISSDLRYTYDAEAEEGERITSLQFQGEPLDDEDTLTVGVGEFLAGGGDGFTAFTEAEERTETEVIDTEVWPDYVAEQDELSPDYALRAVEFSGVEPDAEFSAGEDISFEVGSVHSMSLGAPEVTEVTAVLRDGEEEIDLGSSEYTVEDGSGTAELAVTIPEEISEDAELLVRADAGGTEALLPVRLLP